MTTIEEIYAAINPMPAMLSAKGKVKPVTQIQIEANARISVHINWSKAGARNDWDKEYKCFIGDTAEEAICEALAFITALPDAKIAKLHDFIVNAAQAGRKAAESALAEAVEVMRLFAEGSIDVSHAVIIGCPEAETALTAARAFVQQYSNGEVK